MAHAAPDALEKIADALAQEIPCLDPDTLVKSVAARAGLGEELVAPVMPVLGRVAIVQRRYDLTAEDLLASLDMSLQDLGDRWSPEDAQAWSARREQFLRVWAPTGALAVATKAIELLWEQQLVFCDARVLTDMRPIFDEAADVVRGFVPFHVLALNYYEGGVTKTTYVAMDLADLSKLIGQLERARRKEQVLRANLRDAGLIAVRMGSDSDA